MGVNFSKRRQPPSAAPRINAVWNEYWTQIRNYTIVTIVIKVLMQVLLLLYFLSPLQWQRRIESESRESKKSQARSRRNAFIVQSQCSVKHLESTQRVFMMGSLFEKKEKLLYLLDFRSIRKNEINWATTHHRHDLLPYSFGHPNVGYSTTAIYFLGPMPPSAALNIFPAEMPPIFGSSYIFPGAKRRLRRR